MNLKKTLALGMVGITCILNSNSIIAGTQYNNNDYITVDTYEGYEDIQPLAVLFDHYITTTNPPYVSNEFATPANNSNNMNVWFRNNTNTPVTVTLQRRGVFNSWSTVGSFSVRAHSEDFREMSATNSTTYRIRVTNSNGATIRGSLRARQL